MKYLRPLVKTTPGGYTQGLYCAPVMVLPPFANLHSSRQSACIASSQGAIHQCSQAASTFFMGCTCTIVGLFNSCLLPLAMHRAIKREKANIKAVQRSGNAFLHFACTRGLCVKCNLSISAHRWYAAVQRPIMQTSAFGYSYHQQYS